MKKITCVDGIANFHFNNEQFKLEVKKINEVFYTISFLPHMIQNYNDTRFSPLLFDYNFIVYKFLPKQARMNIM